MNNNKVDSGDGGRVMVESVVYNTVYWGRRRVRFKNGDIYMVRNKIK